MDYDDLLKKIKEFGRYQIYVTAVTTSIWLANTYNHLSIIFLAVAPDFWCKNNVDSLRNGNTNGGVFADNGYQINVNKSQGVTDLATTASPASLASLASSYPSLSLPQCDVYVQKNASSFSESEGVANILSLNQSFISSGKCQEWVYDRTQYQSTIVTEWDVVCEQRWMVTVASSVYMAGLLVGVMIFGIMSDKLGRRKTLLFTYVGMMSMQFAVAFAPSMIMFIIFRFFVAFFTQGMVSAAYVIALEMTGPSWRLVPWAVHKATWSFFVMVLAGIAYVIRSWRTLQLVLACQSIPFLLYFVIIPESARWLYANQRHKEADKLVRKIAKWNNTEKYLPDELNIQVKGSQKANVWDLVRTPKIRKRALIIFLYWAVTSMVYFGLALNVGKLAGSTHLNLFIAGALELTKDILLYPLVRYMGRRLPTAGSMVGAGLCLLVTLAIPAENWIIIVTLSVIGRVLVSASFNMAYLCSAEMFPTLLRSAAVGTSSMTARIGGVLAPIIGDLDEYNPVIPPLVFGVSALVSGTLSLLLPETMGTKLPESIDDIENPKLKESSISLKAKEELTEEA